LLASIRLRILRCFNETSAERFNPSQPVELALGLSIVK
jgi:hypothetical protein